MPDLKLSNDSDFEICTNRSEECKNFLPFEHLKENREKSFISDLRQPNQYIKNKSIKSAPTVILSEKSFKTTLSQNRLSKFSIYIGNRFLRDENADEKPSILDIQNLAFLNFELDDLEHYYENFLNLKKTKKEIEFLKTQNCFSYLDVDKVYDILMDDIEIISSSRYKLGKFEMILEKGLKNIFFNLLEANPILAKTKNKEEAIEKFLNLHKNDRNLIIKQVKKQINNQAEERKIKLALLEKTKESLENECEDKNNLYLEIEKVFLGCKFSSIKMEILFLISFLILILNPKRKLY